MVLNSDSQVAGITDMSHYAWLVDHIEIVFILHVFRICHLERAYPGVGVLPALVSHTYSIPGLELE
jgi:hypothetical protein